MADQAKSHFSQKKTKKGVRVRVREVDFSRVEGSASGDQLALFELEVKEGLASAQSPLNELMAQEDHEAAQEAQRIAQYRLACVFRKLRLTAQQIECYRCLWGKQMSEPETAQKMGLSRSRVRDLRSLIHTRLMSLKDTKKKNAEIGARLRLGCKTPVQVRIWNLRFKKGMTPTEISKEIGMSRQAVCKYLRMISEGV